MPEMPDFVMPPIQVPPTTPRMRGALDCYQDRCENIPFASIGGLDSRSNMKQPKYITPEEAQEYLAGYRAMAQSLYGETWQTCSFGWAPALELPNESTEQRVLNLIAGGATPEEAGRTAGLMLGTVESIIARDLERRARDA
jgi:hypothetical protein